MTNALRLQPAGRVSLGSTIGLAVLAGASVAFADPVTIDFEGLDASHDLLFAGPAPYGAIGDLFASSGIDFGTTIGARHLTQSFAPGADGDISITNVNPSGERINTIEMSAVGPAWDAFSVFAYTEGAVTMSAFGVGGALLESINLPKTMGSVDPWRSFAFSGSVSGIARVEFTTASFIFIDTIHFDPTDSVVIPLPGSGMLAIAGLAAIGMSSRRRS